MAIDVGLPLECSVDSNLQRTELLLFLYAAVKS